MPTLFSFRLVLVLSLTIVLMSSHTSQAADSLPLVYRLKANTLLQECTADGQKNSMLLHNAPAKARFTIVNTKKDADGNYIIQFAEWIPLGKLPRNLRSSGSAFTANSTTLQLTDEQQTAFWDSYYFDLNYDASTGLERYFLISTEQLTTIAEPLAKPAIAIGGAMVMPFKFRPSTGDFTKDVTFSGLAGPAFSLNRSTHHSLATLLGIGITSATLTPANSSVTTTEDRAAITFSGALLYQWDRLQVGLLLGTDILGEGNKDWKYNKKLWLAAGIGFNIFKPEDTTAKDAGENKGNK